MNSFMNMFNATNIKQFMFDTFAEIVNQKYGINISGLRNPTELFSLLTNLQEIFQLYQTYGSGKYQPSEIERLKGELDHFCRQYQHVLPNEWIRLAQQLNNNSDVFVRNMYLNVLSWWNGLGAGYVVVQAVMYANQWNEVAKNKREIEELLRVGHDYVDIDYVKQQLEVLRQRANRVEQLVRRYRFTQDRSDQLLQQIRCELNEANQREYREIMRVIQQLKQHLESESKSLSDRRNNIGMAETASWVGAAVGVGLTLFSLFDKKNSSTSTSRVNPKVGMTVTAASVASLALTTNEKCKLDARLDLLKDRFNRLTAVDAQLAEIRARLAEFEDYIK